MRSALTLGLFLFVVSPAAATTVTIDLPGDGAPDVKTVDYSCPSRTIGVTYINTTDNQFAVLDLGDRKIVTVSVLSGSGARYVGQTFQWWTKGEDATFTDLIKGGDSGEVCKQAG